MPRCGPAGENEETYTCTSMATNEPAGLTERCVVVIGRPNHVWPLDFQFDQTSDCRVLKYLNITDEFGNEALDIEVKWSMSGNDIVTILEALINFH